MKVSVLVPVYNVKPYLSDCLNSLLDQILDDIEIVAIDDGSTDGSSEILEKFAEKDPRVKILKKDNTGYGDSMNKGLEIAEGEYIGILEPDDFADPAMYIELYALAKKYRADLVRCNYFELRNGENTLHVDIQPDETGYVLDPLEDTRIFYKPPAIWSAIYRREFLLTKKIQFLPTPGASYQDASFNFKTLASGGKIVLSEKAYVHYRRDNESASVKSQDKVFSVCEEYAEIERFLKENGTYETYGRVMQAVKFAAYHWNLLRISDADVKKFLLRLRVEFEDAKKQGMLEKRYFEKKHWRALQLILKHNPDTFLKIFKLYRGKKRRKL